MRLVYISSPLRGDVERNIQRARDYCAYAASCGVIPLAPHTIFTQYLDDEQPEQREQGLRMGRDLMWRCDDLWVVGSTISSGMREEIELAKKLYMPFSMCRKIWYRRKLKSVSRITSLDWMTALREAARAAMRDRFLS